MIKNTIIISGIVFGGFLCGMQKPPRMENFARTRELMIVTQNLRDSASRAPRENSEMKDDYKNAFPDITKKADSMWGDYLPSRTDAIYWRYLDGLLEKNDLERAQNFLRTLHPEYIPNILNMNRASNRHVNDDDTLIIKAVRAKNYNSVRFLIARGASIAEPGNNGWTALHHAARNDDVEMIDILSEASDFKVDILIEKHQSTPLHIAAIRGNSNAVKLLLQLKADVDAQEIRGRRAWDLVSISIERLGRNIVDKGQRARLCGTREVLEPYKRDFFSRLLGNLP